MHRRLRSCTFELRPSVREADFSNRSSTAEQPFHSTFFELRGRFHCTPRGNQLLLGTNCRATRSGHVAACYLDTLRQLHLSGRLNRSFSHFFVFPPKLLAPHRMCVCVSAFTEKKNMELRGTSAPTLSPLKTSLLSQS